MGIPQSCVIASMTPAASDERPATLARVRPPQWGRLAARNQWAFLVRPLALVCE